MAILIFELIYFCSVLNLGVYGLFGALQAVAVLGFSFSLAIGSLKASVKLHDGMLRNILRSPMSFFDTTPLGRILNRFSKVRRPCTVYDDSVLCN